MFEAQFERLNGSVCLPAGQAGEIFRLHNFGISGRPPNESEQVARRAFGLRQVVPQPRTVVTSEPERPDFALRWRFDAFFRRLAAFIPERVKPRHDRPDAELAARISARIDRLSAEFLSDNSDPSDRSDNQ